MDFPLVSSLFGLISALAAMLWRASTLVEKIRMSHDVLERTLTKLEKEVETIRVLPQIVVRLETLERNYDMFNQDMKEFRREFYSEKS